MLYGNSNEIAASFVVTEKSIDSHFIFGDFNLIIGGAVFLSEHKMLTLNFILNKLKVKIKPYPVKMKKSKEDLYFIGCLFSGYLYDNIIPDIPSKIRNSEEYELKKFTDDYFDLLKRIHDVFDERMEIQLPPELIDKGCRFFLFEINESEFIVCTQDGGQNINLFKLAAGSYERFIKSLPANILIAG